MKIVILAICTGLSTLLFSFNSPSRYYTVETVPKNMTVTMKKDRFYQLVIPPITRVHKDLMRQYIRIERILKYNSNSYEIKRLKKLYRIDSNKDLLLALKPHPKSIVIAQAAMESAWGTSRFFREAKNIFGMWSKNKSESRIAAGVKRQGKHTIWLRKFYSLEESVKAYYELMGKGRAFKEFRRVRNQTNDVHLIVKKLDKYSEIGEVYGQELSKLIRYNKLTLHDK